VLVLHLLLGHAQAPHPLENLCGHVDQRDHRQHPRHHEDGHGEDLADIREGRADLL
jgi:hypothetical protein